ncbi:MAG TPA: BatD family protein, partial [Polyangiaceae bacterium]|nr:BatD family protein [Polyangiaceae bacterium]
MTSHAHAGWRRAARLGSLLLLAATCGSTPVRAQSGLQLQTELSARRVEAGQIFQLQLTALAESQGAPPSAPRLQVPPGFSVQGPTVSSQQQVSIMGGSIQQRQGLTATWLLTTNQTGIFKLGPASVAVGGQRAQGQVVQIQVVPRGQSSPQAAPG